MKRNESQETSPFKASPGVFSPIVGHEEDVRGADDHLQPAPVCDEVGQQREEKNADAEEHLVKDSHRASVLHPHDLCD